jgi:hypothetical protein
MKSVKRRKINGAWIPFTLRPRKKYPFPTPIRPCSVVRVARSSSRRWLKNVGRRFRIGYYSWMDGLDCIWLVNDEGKYEQTIDHDFLQKYFEVETVSKERSLYGRNRPQLGRMK